MTVEAISEAANHYEKRLAYQQIPTLLEYLIVAQDRIQVDIFRRRKADSGFAKR